ncbi:small basic family protein [Calidifontibacter terrae]
MIPAFGLAIGLIVGVVLSPDVPLWLQPYLPIAVIAALDAVFGAVRAVLDGIFDDKVFVVSFLSNVLVAAFIVFLGDQLGVGSQ